MFDTMCLSDQAIPARGRGRGRGRGAGRGGRGRGRGRGQPIVENQIDVLIAGL